MNAIETILKKNATREVCSSIDKDYNTRGNGDKLLVDWPTNRNCVERPRKPKKQVRFCDVSHMRIYTEDYFYSKSYTKEERKMFCITAFADASKIKSALARTGFDYAMPPSIHHLASRSITKEEVVGLENAILGKSPTDTIKLRKLVKEAILSEQEIQKKMSYSDDARMAELSRLLSRISRKNARTRAAIAA